MIRNVIKVHNMTLDPCTISSQHGFLPTMAGLLHLPLRFESPPLSVYRDCLADVRDSLPLYNSA